MEIRLSRQPWSPWWWALFWRRWLSRVPTTSWRRPSWLGAGVSTRRAVPSNWLIQPPLQRPQTSRTVWRKGALTPMSRRKRFNGPAPWATGPRSSPLRVSQSPNRCSRVRPSVAPQKTQAPAIQDHLSASHVKSPGLRNVEMSELGVHGSASRRARSSSDNSVTSSGSYEGSIQSQCRQMPATTSYELGPPSPRRSR